MTQNSDTIEWNLEKFEAFDEVLRSAPQTTKAKAHEKLSPKDRIFVINDVGNGVYVTKYYYNKQYLEYFLQSLPNKLNNENKCDLNGVGCAIFGDLLSQYMKDASLEQFCKVGNVYSYIIFKNIV